MTQTITVTARNGLQLLKELHFSIGQTISVGRSDERDIILNARDISRHHCDIELQAQGFRVFDFSLNGVSAPISRSDGLIQYNTSFGIGSLQLHFKITSSLSDGSTEAVPPARTILAKLIDELEISEVNNRSEELEFRVEGVLNRLLDPYNIEQVLRNQMVRALKDEALGLGPLESLLRDNAISEIMVNSPNTIYVERNGILEKSPLTFSSESSVRTAIDRIVAPLGRRVDDASPLVDARLADGSRVNAVVPPLALKGATITIRKFFQNALTAEEMVNYGTLTEDMAAFLRQAVIARQNIVISGGTGSGKTTLLNMLSASIPEAERIITIEDAAELKLRQPHVVSLEARPMNSEGRGEITIRDLVKNALRMRPDRIIIGECRGGETLDMLQAMNTGHDGSLTTTHANSPTEAITRLETLAMLSGLALPVKAIRQQISGAIDIIVQQKRFADGKRRITAISEVGGMDKDGEIEIFELWRYVPSNQDISDGLPAFQQTGRIPGFQLREGYSCC